MTPHDEDDDDDPPDETLKPAVADTDDEPCIEMIKGQIVSTKGSETLLRATRDPSIASQQVNLDCMVASIIM